VLQRNELNCLIVQLLKHYTAVATLHRRETVVKCALLHTAAAAVLRVLSGRKHDLIEGHYRIGIGIKLPVFCL
jgi:hypothetical protein